MARTNEAMFKDIPKQDRAYVIGWHKRQWDQTTAPNFGAWLYTLEEADERCADLNQKYPELEHFKFWIPSTERIDGLWVDPKKPKQSSEVAPEKSIS